MEFWFEIPEEEDGGGCIPLKKKEVLGINNLRKCTKVDITLLAKRSKRTFCQAFRSSN